MRADREPVEATIRGNAVVDRLGREHHLVVVQPAQRRLVGLVPDHPWHGIVGASEGDVWLNPVARWVDVEARVAWAGADARDARLLPAEAPDRRHVTADGDARRGYPVAVRSARTDGPHREDLVGTADGLCRNLLPGDPGAGLGRIDRRATRDRRVLGMLVG